MAGRRVEDFAFSPAFAFERPRRFCAAGLSQGLDQKREASHAVRRLWPAGPGRLSAGRPGSRTRMRRRSCEQDFRTNLPCLDGSCRLLSCFCFFSSLRIPAIFSCTSTWPRPARLRVSASIWRRRPSNEAAFARRCLPGSPSAALRMAWSSRRAWSGGGTRRLGTITSKAFRLTWAAWACFFLKKGYPSGFPSNTAKHGFADIFVRGIRKMVVSLWFPLNKFKISEMLPSRNGTPASPGGNPSRLHLAHFAPLW